MRYLTVRRSVLVCLIFGLLLVGHRFLVTEVSGMTPAQPAPSQAPPSSGSKTGGDTTPASGKAEPTWMFLGVALPATVALNVAAAFIVGLLGASAFLVGVYTGFISRDARAKILEFLCEPKSTPLDLVVRLAAYFILFGGVIAAVFQWAQGSTFAPIQAFVLGATWPSVVTRVMAGDASTQQQPAPPPPNTGPPPSEAVVVPPGTPKAPPPAAAAPAPKP